MPAKYTPLAVDDDSQTPLPPPRLSSATRRLVLCVLLLLILLAVGYQSTNLSFQDPDLGQVPDKVMSGKLNVA
jgi:hypothetical protein